MNIYFSTQISFTNKILIDGRVFVTARRELGPGAPATLATVIHKVGPGSPLLRPDWSWHNNSCICNGIMNVYRVHVSNIIFSSSVTSYMHILCIFRYLDIII